LSPEAARDLIRRRLIAAEVEPSEVDRIVKVVGSEQYQDFAEQPLLFLEDGSGKAHVIRSNELRQLFQPAA